MITEGGASQEKVPQHSLRSCNSKAAAQMSCVELASCAISHTLYHMTHSVQREAVVRESAGLARSAGQNGRVNASTVCVLAIASLLTSEGCSTHPSRRCHSDLRAGRS